MPTATKKTTKRTATKQTPKDSVKTATKLKVKRDRFGSRPETESGKINAAMTTTPQTIAENV